MLRHTLLACFLPLALPVLAQEVTPKLGPNAIPLTQNNAYLRQAAAPDYWAYSAFVKPQFTTSACSIAAVTAAVNGLQGLPDGAEDPVMSQPDLLKLTDDAAWSRLSAEGGDGVTFDQLVTFAAKAMAARGVQSAKTTVFKPADASAQSLNALRGELAANEKTADDALLVYFNQGVVTGDWDGPHVALIGAFDAGSDQVLILEVDQEWYVPYWTPAPVLLDAMLKPTSAEHGPLEGETGGLVRLAK